MKKTFIALAIVLACLTLLVASCTDGGTGDGQATTGVIIRTDGKLPAGFPKADLKPYPGATITQATVDTRASMCVMETSDEAEKVLDFYANHLEKRRYVQGGTKDIGLGRMIKYDGPGGQVSLTAVAREDSTLINLVLSNAAPEDEITAAEAGISVPQPAVEIPAGFPSDILPSYAGWNLEKATLNEKEAVLIFNSKDTPATLLAFYQQHFESLGMEVGEDVSIKKMRYLAFFGEDLAIGVVLQPLSAGLFRCRLTYEFDFANIPEVESPTPAE